MIVTNESYQNLCVNHQINESKVKSFWSLWFIYFDFRTFSIISVWSDLLNKTYYSTDFNIRADQSKIFKSVLNLKTYKIQNPKRFHFWFIALMIYKSILIRHICNNHVHRGEIQSSVKRRCIIRYQSVL